MCSYIHLFKEHLLSILFWQRQKIIAELGCLKEIIVMSQSLRNCGKLKNSLKKII